MRALLIAVGIVVVAGTPAFAHTGFNPEEAAPGSVATVSLNAADERDNANIVKVELFAPDDVVVAFANPAAATAGWTGAVLEDRVEWTGPATDGDQSFTITMGPLPAEQVRLQFRVLQTYDNGDVDRWIEPNPVGGPEPEMPGPVIDLVEGAPGEVPAETVPEASPHENVGDTTTSLEVTPLEAGDDDATTTAAGEEAEDEEDDGMPTGIIVLVLVVGLAAIGGGIYLIRKNRT